MQRLYEGMKSIEKRICQDLFHRYPTLSESCDFNVRLPVDGLEYPEGATAKERDHWAKLRAKRIDVLFAFGDRWVVCEVADVATEDKVDQAARYARRYAELTGTPAPVEALVLCRDVQQSVIEYAKRQGVKVRKMEKLKCGCATLRSYGDTAQEQAERGLPF